VQSLRKSLDDLHKEVKEKNLKRSREHLVSKEQFHAHSSRLKYYCDKDLDVTLDLKMQITHDEMRYMVSKILSHDFKEEEYKLLVSWQGFDDEDATWEPISILKEDVPELVKAYVLKIDNVDKHKNNLVAIISS
jgi:hypothetical protein